MGKADHLIPHQFKKGETSRRHRQPRGSLKKASKVSLTADLKRYFEKNPDARSKLSELLVKIALGEVSPEQADILQKVRSVEAYKELYNRMDGPLIKRQTNIIRSDKTVILHDGAAVNINVGEKNDPEDDDRVIDVSPSD